MLLTVRYTGKKGNFTVVVFHVHVFLKSQNTEKPSNYTKTIKRNFRRKTVIFTVYSGTPAVGKFLSFFFLLFF